MQFITSWDDGRKTDLRIAAMLEKYGLTGTFYVSPPETNEKPALSTNEILEIASRHTIGAHSMTHPRLTRIPIDQAKREIEESKQWIEGITGKECNTFCYPAGDFNDQTKKLVKEAGFVEARTVEQLEFKSADYFASPTTLQVYPFPFRKRWTRWWHYIDPLVRLRVFLPRMIALRLPPKAYASWAELAKSLYRYAQKTNQPFFHLWGHSWEIEKYGMWEELEEFLRFVESNNEVIPIII
ncbi:polysaccharide deacetylase family protein [Patescibacteria group bacterium]|nr:polysaccharide deacetylase family protein [Patescibacteria group bacterium]MBU1123631.1 polysaccharide deacetylase family protein [Patescibacteria group bacterium]